MPRATWPLHKDRPAIQILLLKGAQFVNRILLADTGAGDTLSNFDLVLDVSDCLQYSVQSLYSVSLGGAYVGLFPVYLLRVSIPQLGFDRYLRAVGVPSCPPGFDGLACFSFLRRFTYGNFGHPDQFGLEL